MEQIDVRRFGFAVGTTMALLYLGCALVMAVAGRQATIVFFNSLLHGVDVAPIIRMEMPVWEAVMGAVETFVIAWLSGAVIAALYNLGGKRGQAHGKE